jgi:hypothetical protein
MVSAAGMSPPRSLPQACRSPDVSLLLGSMNRHVLFEPALTNLIVEISNPRSGSQKPNNLAPRRPLASDFSPTTCSPAPSDHSLTSSHPIKMVRRDACASFGSSYGSSLWLTPLSPAMFLPRPVDPRSTVSSPHLPRLNSRPGRSSFREAAGRGFCASPYPLSLPLRAWEGVWV